MRRTLLVLLFVGCEAGPRRHANLGLEDGGPDGGPPALLVDLRVDADRDGTLSELDTEGPDGWGPERGAVFLAKSLRRNVIARPSIGCRFGACPGPACCVAAKIIIWCSGTITDPAGQLCDGRMARPG